MTSDEAAGAAPIGETAASALAANDEDHDDGAAPEDHSATTVTLEGDTARAQGGGVSVDGSVVTITEPGTYEISGSLDDGSVVVRTSDDGVVRLVLGGVDITSSTGAAIDVLEADEVIVELTEGTVNRLADTDRPDGGVDTDTGSTDGADATLHSMADLTITGDGSLAVTGHEEDGISSKDGLVIRSGRIQVSAPDDGIRGKDYVVMDGGSIVVDAGGDGIKSDDDEDATRGYVAVNGGDVTINAGVDGVDASTDVAIVDGIVSITTGAGAGSDAPGGKGIKGSTIVAIDGGTVSIDSADDAIHSNGTVVVNGGVVTAATADDGVHADAELVVNGGALHITRSYEGLESTAITLAGGDITIVSSDDGINAAGGNDGSGVQGPGGGGDRFAGGAATLDISGGTVAVDAGGDGIDVNGAASMSGGRVVVDGPTAQMDGAIDHDGGWDQTGGTLIATGSSGMVSAPDRSSSQASLSSSFASHDAGSTVEIRSVGGATITTVTPSKAFQSIVVSTPDVAADVTYQVVIDGTVVDETTTAEGATSGMGGVGGRPGRR